MYSEFTATDVFASFVDELEKIAEDKKQPEPLTKERFKRHLKTVAAVGLGSGLGFGTAEAMRRFSKTERWAKLKDKIPPSVRKYAPHAVMAISGAQVMLEALRRNRIKDYIEHGPTKSKQ